MNSMKFIWFKLINAFDRFSAINRNSSMLYIFFFIFISSQFVVLMSFKGLTPCSIEVPVNVKVIDRSMPTFDKQFYTDDVFENIEVDTPLSLSIQAKSDLDRKLIYSITKGNDFEEFALNFNTGELNIMLREFIELLNAVLCISLFFILLKFLSTLKKN